MKKVSLKISYEPEADVLAWETGKGAIYYAEEMGNVVVHFSKKNTPIFIEILEASKFLSKAEKLVSLGQKELARV